MNALKLASLMVGALAVLQVISAVEILTSSDFNRTIIKEVYVSSCPPRNDSEHCTIKLGTKVTYRVEFETSQSFKRAILQVGSREGDEYTDFSFTLACNYLGLLCPSEAGQNQVLTHVSEINRRYPTNSTHYRLRLYDDMKNIIFTVQFPTKIVK